MGKSWTAKLAYGGMLALLLSYLTAHYFSTSLFAFYHDWTGWRYFTGHSPNTFTGPITQISWALIFCTCWWMLWRLDHFISNPSGLHEAKEEKQTNEHKNERTEGQKYQHREDPQKTENFVPEQDDLNPEGQSQQSKQPDEKEESKQVRKFVFPQAIDLEMAEVLGLDKENLEDFPKIKETYRSAIAQYHPDKVSALGSEIRDVAEKKAKEINQAYEHFRKKFKKP